MHIREGCKIKLMEMEGANKNSLWSKDRKGKTGLKAEWIQWKKKMTTNRLCTLFDHFHIWGRCWQHTVSKYKTSPLQSHYKQGEDVYRRWNEWKM